ncbi:MAG: SdiA-regulated domain-containing protein [bacterium]
MIPNDFLTEHSGNILSKYNFSSSSRQIVLPKKLKEISGLDVNINGNLFGHTDEDGTIYQIDPVSGKILKSFEIGKKKIKEDFEDITIVGDDFYLVTSGGDIYKFKEGKDKEEVNFTVFRTPLKDKYDVEGICFDHATNSLLLACKDYAGKDYKGNRAVYSFSLKDKKLADKPRFLLPIKRFEKESQTDRFQPSAITNHTASGNFLILSGKGLLLVEISKDGKILGEVDLKSKYHKQPEGIAFMPDKSIVISDEGLNGNATLTFYSLKK